MYLYRRDLKQIQFSYSSVNFLLPPWLLNTINILTEWLPFTLTEEDQETEETLKNIIMISFGPGNNLLHDAMVLLVILKSHSWHPVFVVEFHIDVNVIGLHVFVKYVHLICLCYHTLDLDISKLKASYHSLPSYSWQQIEKIQVQCRHLDKICPLPLTSSWHLISPQSWDEDSPPINQWRTLSTISHESSVTWIII